MPKGYSAAHGYSCGERLSYRVWGRPRARPWPLNANARGTLSVVPQGIPSGPAWGRRGRPRCSPWEIAWEPAWPVGELMVAHGSPLWPMGARGSPWELVRAHASPWEVIIRGRGRGSPREVVARGSPRGSPWESSW